MYFNAERFLETFPDAVNLSYMTVRGLYSRTYFVDRARENSEYGIRLTNRFLIDKDEFNLKRLVSAYKLTIDWKELLQHLPCWTIEVSQFVKAGYWSCDELSISLILNDTFLKEVGDILPNPEFGFTIVSNDQKFSIMHNPGLNNMYRLEDYNGGFFLSHLVPRWRILSDNSIYAYFEEVYLKYSSIRQEAMIASYLHMNLTERSRDVPFGAIWSLILPTLDEENYVEVEVREKYYLFTFSDLITACLAMFTALLNVFAVLFPNTLPFRRFAVSKRGLTNDKIS